jgi:hypothetical protein
MNIDLKHFGMWYIGILVGLMILSVAIETFLNFSMPTAVGTIAPPMVAAMVAGQRFVAQNKAGIERNVMWSEALRMTAVITVVNILLFIGFLFVPGIRDLFLTVGFTLLVILFAILMLVTFVIVRMGLGMGIRAGLNALSEG